MNMYNCPHCGGLAELKGRKKRRVECTKCGASGPVSSLASVAIDGWNAACKILCKDCSYFDEDEEKCDYWSSEDYVSRFDYCSKAERKKE